MKLKTTLKVDRIMFTLFLLFTQAFPINTHYYNTLCLAIYSQYAAMVRLSIVLLTVT